MTDTTRHKNKRTEFVRRKIESEGNYVSTNIQRNDEGKRNRRNRHNVGLKQEGQTKRTTNTKRIE